MMCMNGQGKSAEQYNEHTENKYILVKPAQHNINKYKRPNLDCKTKVLEGANDGTRRRGASMSCSFAPVDWIASTKG